MTQPSWLMVSRRRVLLGGLSTLLVSACLDADNEGDAELAILGDDFEPGQPTGDIALKQWTWDESEPIESTISDALPAGFSLDITSFDDRASLEAAVAHALTNHAAPGCFETVTGEELWRYVTAHTVHDIPDLVTGDFLDDCRPGVPETVLFDGEPWAVPVGLRCQNWCAVMATDDVSADTLRQCETFEEFLAELPGSDSRIAVQESAQGLFQLFCLEMLSHHGTGGFKEIVEGSPRIGTVTPAIEALNDAMAIDALELIAGDWTPSTVESAGVDAAIGAPQLYHSFTESGISWTPVRWPGTQSYVSLSVIGYPFPKRSPEPQGTTKLLHALADNNVQSTIAPAMELLPARSTADIAAEIGPPVASYRDWIDSAEHVIPSVATGCGLDSDARIRAIECFDPATFVETPTDDIARKLQAAL